MTQVIYWEGPGYYSARQEGAHELQCVILYYMGVDDDPDETVSEYARRACVGTPEWLDEVPNDYTNNATEVVQ